MTKRSVSINVLFAVLGFITALLFFATPTQAQERSTHTALTACFDAPVVRSLGINDTSGWMVPNTKTVKESEVADLVINERIYETYQPSDDDIGNDVDDIDNTDDVGNTDTGDDIDTGNDIDTGDVDNNQVGGGNHYGNDRPDQNIKDEKNKHNGEQTKSDHHDSNGKK